MIVEGTNFRITATITLDGVACNLANSTPTMKAIKPDGTAVSLVTVVSNVAGGIVYSDVTAVINNLPGSWSVWVEVIYLSGMIVRTTAAAISVARVGQVV